MNALTQELKRWLDTQKITGETIGSIRRSLFVPWSSEWNAIVRTETAAREVRIPEAPAALSTTEYVIQIKRPSLGWVDYRGQKSLASARAWMCDLMEGSPSDQFRLVFRTHTDREVSPPYGTCFGCGTAPLLAGTGCMGDACAETGFLGDACAQPGPQKTVYEANNGED